LDAFLDRNMLPGDDARFAAHLRECAACREAVAEQQWIDGLLRSPAGAQLEMPSPLFVHSLHASLARRRRRSRIFAAGLAAAAVLLVAAGWLALYRQTTEIVGRSDAIVATAEADRGKAPVKPSGQIATDAARATGSKFIGGADVIVVPVESKHPNVTIVRVYPAYQPVFAAQAYFDQTSEGVEFVSPEFNGG
jgi:hypothetical protein